MIHTDRKETRLAPVFWTLGIVAAAIQAFVYRQWMNGDGISYADMSDAIQAHDWSRLVSVHWSPLYPFLIGLANAMPQPSAHSEFPVIHLVNFGCFLLALGAFGFFLRSVWRSAGAAGEPAARLPLWAVQTIGYSLFLWASIGLLTLMRPQPDLLMSVFVYLASGLLLRIRSHTGGMAACALLGVTLGLGYLAKGPMFPLAVLMVGSMLFFGGRLGSKVKNVAVAGLCFAMTALPFAWAVSRQAHHVTFGQSGTWNYLLFIDRVDAYEQNLGAARGTFVHPVRRLIAGEPPAYSLTRPVAVTYPAWYDPGYWIEGVHPVLQLKEQAKVIAANLALYWHIAAGLAGVIAAVLVLGYLSGFRLTWQALAEFWPLYLFCAVALAAYASLIVEERYVGAFLVLGGVCLFGGFRFSRPAALRVVAIVVALIVVNLAINGAVHVRRDYSQNVSKTHLPDAEAAAALHRLGLAAGDSVASITPWVTSGWARLARVRIVAEVRRAQADLFWKAAPEHRSAVLEAFAGAGCKAVVAWIGAGELPAGWQRLGPHSSPYGVYLLAH